MAKKVLLNTRSVRRFNPNAANSISAPGGVGEIADWKSQAPTFVSYNGAVDVTADSISGGNGGVVSQQCIKSGKGGYEFTAGPTPTRSFVGLTSNLTTATNWTRGDFVVYLYLGQLRAYSTLTAISNASAVMESQIGSYAPGDKIAVEVDGGVVKVYKNGEDVHTFHRQVPATYPLYPYYWGYANHNGIKDMLIYGEDLA